MCPSIGPLLHGVVIDTFTASKSRLSVLANLAVNRNPETVAESIPLIQSLGTSPAQHGSKLENESAQFVSPGQKPMNASKCLFCPTDRVCGGMLRSADTRPAEQGVQVFNSMTAAIQVCDPEGKGPDHVAGRFGSDALETLAHSTTGRPSPRRCRLLRDL
jgi:hypothetical protein